MQGPGQDAYYSSHLAYYSKPFWLGQIHWMVSLLLIPKYCISIIPGPYLVVITKKTLVGLIKGHEVWKIKGTDVLAFPRATLHLTEKQVCLPKNDKKCYGSWKNSGCFLRFLKFHVLWLGALFGMGFGPGTFRSAINERASNKNISLYFHGSLWLGNWWKN